jgi:hypothetical protein
MPPNNIGIVHGGDRGGRVIPPPPSSSSEESDSVGVSSPPLSPPCEQQSGLSFSLFMPTMLHYERVLGQANAPLYAMGTPETLRKVTSAMRRQNLTS